MATMAAIDMSDIGQQGCPLPDRVGKLEEVIAIRTFSRRKYIRPLKYIGPWLASVALLFGFAAPAEAELLVSNMEQGDNSNHYPRGSRIIYQQFSTGNNRRGYDVKSVTLRFKANVPTIQRDLKFEIREGIPQSTRICTLGKPSSRMRGDRTFSAADCPNLDKNKSYYLTIITSQSDKLVRVSSNREASGKAPGWSISNGSRTLSGGLFYNHSESLKFSMKGEIINTLPTAEDSLVEVTEDTAYSFAATDFNFSDLDNDDALDHLTIVTLPADSQAMAQGTLALNGVAVTAGDEVTKQSLIDSKLTYTPPANANGDDYASFKFKVNDGTSDSESAYIMSIDIDPRNDKPIGQDGTVTTDKNTAYSFTVADFGFMDVDTDELVHVKITSLAGEGSLSLDDQELDSAVISNSNPVELSKEQLDDGLLIYTPPADRSGSALATFSFKLNDGELDSDPQTISIDVKDEDIVENKNVVWSGGTEFFFSENDDIGNRQTDTNPVATITVTAPEGEVFTGAGRLYQDENGNDNDQSKFHHRFLTNADNTTFQISFYFINPPDFENPTDVAGNNVYKVGAQVLIGSLIDGSRFNRYITITVTDVNEAPVAVKDATSTAEDTVVDIDVLENDTDLDDLDNDMDEDVKTTLSVIRVGTENEVDTATETNPANGTAVWDPSKELVTYTPDDNFNGTDTFTYVVSDGELTAVGTVSVTVNAVNDPPVAENSDDETAALLFTPSSLTLVGGGSGSYTVALASQPTAAVTVSIGSSSGLTVDTDAATNGNQTSLSFSASNWNTPQTVAVSGEQDDDTVDDTVTLSHTASGGNYAAVIANLSVIVTDDDQNICERMNALSSDGIICDLSFKGITSLSSGDFNDLSKLQYLNLSENELSNLPEDIFNGLSNLEKLDLTYNGLRSLPEDVFDGLSNLQSISLGHNPLRSLSKDVFNGLSNLKGLDLAYSELNSLPEDIFAGLSNLKELTLYENFLSSLPEDIFAGLSNLQDLGLGSNNLSSLPKNIFAGLSNLQNLDVSNNGLNCLPTSLPPNVSVDPAGLPRCDETAATATLLLTPERLTVAEGGSGSYTVALASEPTATVTVSIGSSSGLTVDTDAATNGNQTSLSFSASNWNTPQTVAVSGEQDDDTVDDTVTLSHTASGGNYAAVIANLSVIVTDDDQNICERMNALSSDGIICDLSFKGITSLSSGDFNDLSKLQYLNLSENELSSLPEDIFNGLSNLEKLDLTYNGLRSLPEDVFDGLSNLQSISLGHNPLRSLSKDVFNGLSNLKGLDLVYSELNSLPEDIFAGLSNLGTLTLYENFLSSLPEDIFAGLSNLQDLGLGSNNLSSLPKNIFAGLSNLQNLDVSNNGLNCLPTSLPPNVSVDPAGLPRCDEIAATATLLLTPERLTVAEGGSGSYTVALASEPTAAVMVSLSSGSGVTLDTDAASDGNQTSLSFSTANWNTPQTVAVSGEQDDDTVDDTVTLSHTASGGNYAAVIANLSVTVTDDDQNICERMNALSSNGIICDLSFKGITSLSSGDFNDLSKLQYLNLSENKLSSLPEDVFNGLSNLEKLDLTYNGLRSLPEDVFDGLSNLQSISLGPNQLRSLSKDVFNGLSNLKELDLAYSELNSLPEDIFAGLSNLKELTLYENFLSSLPEDIFAGLSNLQGLGLGSNNLSSLPKNIFAGLSNLQNLDVSNNGLNCLPTSLPPDVSVDPAGLPRCDEIAATATLLLTPERLTVAEGGSGSYTVALASEPTATVTVSIGSSSGLTVDTDAATNGNQTSLSFSASNWNTPQTVAVSGEQDDDTVDDTVTLSHTASGGNYAAVIANLSVIVTDDDQNICERMNALSSDGIICDLSFKGITSLSSSDFNDLSKLQYLNLSENELSSLPEDIFNGLSNLEKLDLTYNGLRSLPEDVFDGLSNLQSISLGPNQLRSLSKDVFNGLSNLKELDLAYSELNSLPEDIFAGLSNLKELTLYENFLSSLPEDIFAGLSNLQGLGLGSNNLSSLPKNIFDGLSNLQNLDVSNNGLNCLPTSLPPNVSVDPAGLPRCDEIAATATLLLTPERLTVAEGGSGSYTVALASEPTAAVMVSLSSGSGVTLDTDAASDGNQTSLSFSTANWNTPQTVAVSGEQDDDTVDDTVVLSHTASGGDYIYVTANLSVTVIDDDKAPALVFTPENPTVAEAGSGSYTVRLAGSPSAAVTVTVSAGTDAGVTLDTDAASDGNQNSLSFTTTNWSTPQTVDVSAGQDDDAVDDTVTLSHSASGGDYGSVTGDLLVTVADDDKAPALVLTPESLTLAEGGSGSYTVALAGSPSAAVTVTVSAGTGVTLDTDADTSGNQTSLNFSAANWNTPQMVDVSAEQDDDAVDDTVTLSHSASGGDYGSISADLVVTVSDDEETTNNINTTAASTPLLMASGTLEPLTLYVGGEDGSRDGHDGFIAGTVNNLIFTFQSSDPTVASVKPESPGSSMVMVTPVREGKATITVTATATATSGNRISDRASFPVTVVTSPAEETAIRSAFSGQGRVVLGSVTDMIGERFDSGIAGTGASGRVCLSSAAGPDGNSGDNTIAGSYGSHGDGSDHLIASDSWQGKSWNTDLAATGLRGVPHVGQRDEDSMDKTFDDLLELFRGQPHSLHSADWGLECGTGAVAEVSRPWTLWAGTDLQWARGGTETSDFDGEWQLYYLGTDRAFTEQWLAGISLSRVWGDVDYSFADATTTGAGQLSSSLTAIYPYLHGQLSNNLELWAIGGIGFGDVENEREHVDGDADQGDLQMRLFSLGLRRSLPQVGSAMDLALSSDAGFVTLSADGDGSLDGAEASMGRFRLGLELSRPFANGVEPFAQLHGRYDSGDGPTGAAGELVLGLRYGDERLDLELRGNHLTSAADFQQWGAKARLGYGPATDGTGLNLALTSQWGAAENGDSFLDGHSMELPTPALVSAQGGSLAAELSGEIGYSLSMGQQWGLLTPNLGYDHSGNGSSRSRVGLAYALSSDLDRDIELRLDLARRERRQEDPDHSIELGASLRF